MRVARLERFFSAMLLVACAVLPAVAGQDTSLLGGGGTLTLSLPPGWHSVAQISGPGTMVQVFSGPNARQATLLITAMPNTPKSQITTPDQLRSFLETAGKDLLADAVQDRIELVALHPKGGSAFLFHLTDRRPEQGPGDFKEMHQGGMLLAGHLLTFTILTHAGEDKLVEQATSVMNSVSLQPD